MPTQLQSDPVLVPANAGRVSGATLPTAESLPATPSLNTGRGISPAPDTTAVGQSITRFGGDVAQAGAELQTTWNNIQDQQVASDYLRFIAGEEDNYQKATDGLDPAKAQGFATSTVQDYRDRANQFYASVPPRLKQKYGDSLFTYGDSLGRSAISAEHGAAQTYSLNSLNQTIQTTILPRAGKAAQLPDSDPNKEPTLTQIEADAVSLIDANPTLTPTQKEKAKQDALTQIETTFAKGLPSGQGIRVDPNTPSQAVGDRIMQVEGVGANPNSGAAGYGQFEPETWLEMVQKYHPELTQGRSREEILALRADPNLGREMTNQYAVENANLLKNAGVDPSPGNTFLAHFLGPSGAVAMLNAPPGTSAASVDPAAAKANPEVFYNRGPDGKPDLNNPKMASDIAQWANGKMLGAALVDWSTRLDAVPYDTKVAIAKDASVEFVREQTALKQQQDAEWTAHYNAMDNAIQDGTFGLTELNQAINGGVFDAHAAQRQALFDKITARDKDAINLASAQATLSNPNYAWNTIDPEGDQKRVDALYKAYGDVTDLLKPPEPPIVGGAEGMVSRPSPGAPALDPKSQLAAFVKQMHIVPTLAKNAIKAGIYSPDPATRDQAFQMMDALSSIDSKAYDAAFTSNDQKRLGIYQALAPLVPQAELEKALAQRTTQDQKSWDDLYKQGLAIVQPSSTSNGIDTQTFINAAGYPNGPGQPSDPEQVNKLRTDYENAFAEAYASVHNIDAATKLAGQWVAHKWGPTDVGNGGHVLTPYPPEKYYPAIGGDQHWMASQLRDTVTAQEPAAKAWGVVPSPQTAVEVGAGVPPSYNVWYQDTSGAFRVLPNPMRFDPAGAQAQAVADFKAKHAAAIAPPPPPSQLDIDHGTGGAAPLAPGEDVVPAPPRTDYGPAPLFQAVPPGTEDNAAAATTLPGAPPAPAARAQAAPSQLDIDHGTGAATPPAPGSQESIDLLKGGALVPPVGGVQGDIPAKPVGQQGMIQHPMFGAGGQSVKTADNGTYIPDAIIKQFNIQREEDNPNASLTPPSLWLGSVAKVDPDGLQKLVEDYGTVTVDAANPAVVQFIKQYGKKYDMLTRDQQDGSGQWLTIVKRPPSDEKSDAPVASSDGQRTTKLASEAYGLPGVPGADNIKDIVGNTASAVWKAFQPDPNATIQDLIDAHKGDPLGTRFIKPVPSAVRDMTGKKLAVKWRQFFDVPVGTDLTPQMVQDAYANAQARQAKAGKKIETGPQAFGAFIENFGTIVQVLGVIGATANDHPKAH